MKNFMILMIMLLGGSSAYSQNTFPATGRVGIGTTTPSVNYLLDVRGGFSAVGGESVFSNFTFVDPAPGLPYSVKIGGGGFAVRGNAFFLDNVGIGTSSPTEKLSVKGKIRAQEIKVEITGWADFVFAKDYKLPTLQETENHIKAKGHLPGIPSAAEVEANGIELGEMNKKLLQKIEELTLHLINQEKRLAKQEEQIRILNQTELTSKNHKE